MHTSRDRVPWRPLTSPSDDSTEMPRAVSRVLSHARHPKLLDQVRRLLRTRHYRYRTEEAYVAWIRRFILFHHKRHPAEMGRVQIEAFLSTLAVERRVAASTQNQALAALLFLYREVIGCSPGWIEDVVRARRPHRLPVVLNAAEVEAVLHRMSGVPWIMAMLLCGAGLRLMECVRLRVKDIDFTRHELVVRAGKGDRDRITMLPAVVGEALADHLRHVERVHRADLQAGLGRVMLPAALAA